MFIIVEDIEVTACKSCPKYCKSNKQCLESGFIVDNNSTIDVDCLFLNNAADEEIFDDDLLDLEDESDESLYFDPGE